MRAGFSVTAIDAFADKETAALAEQTILVNTNGFGFDADSLMAAITTLNTSRYIGFVYGSGFEAQPALLRRLAETLPIIGNAPEVVAALKNPTRFFSKLRQLSINFPATHDAAAEKQSANCLLKYGGGSGGMHIRVASLHQTLPGEGYYFQENISGKSVSLLFLADRHTIAVIGFNEQWLSPSAEMPYRYGGAVSQAALSTAVKTQLCDAANKLTQAYALVGLNSLDAVVAADDVVYVLEINPRLSATIDLYAQTQPTLLKQHVDSALNAHCLKNGIAQPAQMPPLAISSWAYAIIYADDYMKLTPPAWPEWVTDTPHPTDEVISIQRGAPICSVKAVGSDAEAAKKLVLERAESLKNLLQSCNQDKH